MAGKAAEKSSLAGIVQIAGSPVVEATVTLYAAGTGNPAKLAQGKTDAMAVHSNSMEINADGSVLYMMAKGGHAESCRG